MNEACRWHKTEEFGITLVTDGNPPVTPRRTTMANAGGNGAAVVFFSRRLLNIMTWYYMLYFISALFVRSANVEAITYDLGPRQAIPVDHIFL